MNANLEVCIMTRLSYSQRLTQAVKFREKAECLPDSNQLLEVADIQCVAKETVIVEIIYCVNVIYPHSLSVCS